MSNNWPTQKNCDVFYGNPRGRNPASANATWEAQNLVYISPPFKMQFCGQYVAKIRVHKKCSEAFLRVFNKIWEAAGKSQSKIDEWGVSVFGGSYNYRQMRGSSALSMHSYGCAIDLDAPRNGYHDQTPNFAHIPQVVQAFESEGATWGGRWSGYECDGMHFQFSNVR